MYSGDRRKARCNVSLRHEVDVREKHDDTLLYWRRSLKTLDLTFHISEQYINFLYFYLYFNTAYVAYSIYCNI